MYVKVKVKGLEFTYNELKSIKALSEEMLRIVKNICDYCDNVGIEIAEYDIKRIDKKPIEDIVNNTVSDVKKSSLCASIKV